MTEGPRENRRDTGRLETEPQYTSPFTVAGRIKSFRHALAGLFFVLRSQHNAWVHAAVTVLVIVLAVVLGSETTPLRTDEWCVLVLAVTIVWVAETLNTGLEVLADALMPERHPTVKIAKDVAAGAVLIGSIGAFVVALFLFVPRFVALFGALGR